MTAEVGRANALRNGLQARLTDRPSRGLAGVGLRVREECGAREDHRHRIRDVLALERGRRPVRGLVYTVNLHHNGPGKLVFVPMSELLALAG